MSAVRLLFTEYRSLLIRSSAEHFQTLRRVLSVTAFCIRIFRAAHRLSSFKSSFTLFWIIRYLLWMALVELHRPFLVLDNTVPVVDGSGGTT